MYCSMEESVWHDNGCVAVAETREDVLRLIQEAIEFHIEGLCEDGSHIPEPISSIEYVETHAV